MIAAFGDLHIRSMWRGKPHARSVEVRDVGGPAGNRHEGPLLPVLPLVIKKTIKKGTGILNLIKPQEGVDLGKLHGQICGIALGKTSTNYQLLTGLCTVKTSAMSIEDGADALLLGRVDKTACIHEHHIGIIGIHGQLVAVLGGIPKEDFCVNKILGTTKTDKADFTRFGRDGVGHLPGNEDNRLLLVIQGMERTRES